MGRTSRHGRLRIEWHYDGFNELRRSLQPQITAAADAIAAAAGDGFGVVHATPNSTRARAIVGTADAEGQRRQAREDVLQRALSAGRTAL